MGSMEQVPLNFNPEENLEKLSIEELEALYYKKVERDPKLRFLGAGEKIRKEILIEGINDPEAGLKRLGDIDAGDNQAARNLHYWDR